MQALIHNPYFTQGIQKITEKITENVQKGLENILTKYGASYQPNNRKDQIPYFLKNSTGHEQPMFLWLIDKSKTKQ